jgi:hypothetical protein
VIASLRRVPDELAHERRQLRFNDLKLAANPTPRSLFRRDLTWP